MALRKGKTAVGVNLKDTLLQKIDIIAEREISSRSAICAKIIEENIDKYIKENSTDA